MSTEVTAVAPPEPQAGVVQAAQKTEKAPEVKPANYAADDNAVELTLNDQQSAAAKKSSEVPVEEIQRNFQQFLDRNFDNKLAFDVQRGQNGGEIHFRITDRDTGKVIREFPPEELDQVEGAVAKGNVLIEQQA